MREFVFRGKPKNKADYEFLKKMYKDNCKDGFIYGSLVVSHGKYYICIMALCQINSLVNNGTTTMFEVILETVGQSTGLTDKNGTRIFEGDVVTYEDAVDNFGGDCNDVFLNCGRVEISEWDGIDFTNRETVEMADLYEYGSETMVDCEIIGNIHDNPELLKG